MICMMFDFEIGKQYDFLIRGKPYKGQIEATDANSVHVRIGRKTRHFPYDRAVKMHMDSEIQSINSLLRPYLLFS